MHRRIFANSGLHIVGNGTPMLGQPEGFLEGVAAYEPPPRTEVELVDGHVGCADLRTSDGEPL